MIRSPEPSLRAALVLMFGSAVMGASHVAAQSDVAFPPEVYAERRARLLDLLQSPIIVPSEYMIRAGGEKKQEPNFFYLTGVESPYAILVISPDGEGGVRDQLFLPAHREFAGAQYSFQDPRLLDAAWNRLIRRLEPGEFAEAATGIAETYPLDDFAVLRADRPHVDLRDARTCTVPKPATHVADGA